MGQMEFPGEKLGQTDVRVTHPCSSREGPSGHLSQMRTGTGQVAVWLSLSYFLAFLLSNLPGAIVDWKVGPTELPAPTVLLPRALCFHTKPFREHCTALCTLGDVIPNSLRETLIFLSLKWAAQRAIQRSQDFIVTNVGCLRVRGLGTDTFFSQN